MASGCEIEFFISFLNFFPVENVESFELFQTTNKNIKSFQIFHFPESYHNKADLTLDDSPKKDQRENEQMHNPSLKIARTPIGIPDDHNLKNVMKKIQEACRFSFSLMYNVKQNITT